MEKRTAYLALGLFISFLIIGCDKACEKTVEDVATIQNMTGQELSLQFCKGRFSEPVSGTLKQDTSFNEVSLGSRPESEIKGGPGATCAGVKDSKMSVDVSLAPESFQQVKLCFDETNNKYVVIGKMQICPTGFFEQTSAEPCQSI